MPTQIILVVNSIKPSCLLRWARSADWAERELRLGLGLAGSSLGRRLPLLYSTPILVGSITESYKNIYCINTQNIAVNNPQI